MAAEPPLAAGSYKYITVDQSVNDALTEFGRNIGVPVQVSKLVKGRLSAGMPIARTLCSGFQKRSPAANDEFWTAD